MTIADAVKFFKGTPYASKVEEARVLAEAGLEQAATDLLKVLPSAEQLMTTLMEKLKGKSVYTNLKKLAESKVQSKYEEAKAWSSLQTHCIIEAEHGHPEYLMLAHKAQQKLTALIY